MLCTPLSMWSLEVFVKGSCHPLSWHLTFNYPYFGYSLDLMVGFFSVT